MIAAIEERTPRPGDGTTLKTGPSGFSYSGGKASATPVEVKQFQIRRRGEGVIEIYYGQVYGLGHSGTLVEMQPKDGDWTEYEISGDVSVYLKIQFEPVAQGIDVYDGTGEKKTIYGVGSGGTEAEISISFSTGTSTPKDVDPVVNAESGDVSKKGTVHVRIGRVTSTALFNDVYGPFNIAFCAPNSIKFVSR